MLTNEGFPEEMTAEEIADFRHMSKVNASLTDDERGWVALQWELQHQVETWRDQIDRRDRRAHHALRSKIVGATITIVAVVLLLILATWGGDIYREGRYAKAKLDYIYDRAPEHQGLKAGLEWIDRELEYNEDLAPPDNYGVEPR